VKARSTIRKELLELEGALARANLRDDDRARLRDARACLRWVLEGAKAKHYVGWRSPANRIVDVRRRQARGS
jgi:hypothetical protein